MSSAEFNRLNQIYSNDAEDFYELLVDSKRLLILSTQFEDFKKVWLKDYQNVVLNNSKIIIDKDEITKNKNNNQKLVYYFQQLKKKIIKNKANKTDKMIIRKL